MLLRLLAQTRETLQHVRVEQQRLAIRERHVAIELEALRNSQEVSSMRSAGGEHTVKAYT